MTVYFVGAGPGDPKLITVRGRELLERARVCIWAGSLVNRALLAYLPAEAEVHDSAGLTREAIIEICWSAERRGLDVVRLHTGDPSLYSAIREQQQALDALMIPWVVVPGVSAFQGAAAALGCELTIPEACQSVVLTRVGGRTVGPPVEALETYARTGATLCLYLSVDALAAIASRLTPVLGADCPAAVVHRATWPNERIVQGSLLDIAELVAAAGIRRHALVIVGRALAPGGPMSRLYSADFSHGCRT